MLINFTRYFIFVIEVINITLRYCLTKIKGPRGGSFMTSPDKTNFGFALLSQHKGAYIDRVS